MIEPMDRVTKEQILKPVQKRVAVVSIGASTVRNQGDANVVKIARGFLDSLNLMELKNIVTVKQFQYWLDEKTIDLANSFEGGAKGNWGAARKSINIFLESCLLNRILSEEFALDKLAKFMETPLDNYAAKKIRKKARLLGISFQGKWKTIKSLTADQSALFQQVALQWANEKKVPRGYLDLWLWQGDSDD